MKGKEALTPHTINYTHSHTRTDIHTHHTIHKLHVLELSNRSKIYSPMSFFYVTPYVKMLQSRPVRTDLLFNIQ